MLSRRLLLAFLFLSVLSSPALADEATPSDVSVEADSRAPSFFSSGFLTVGFGAYWQGAGQSQTLQPANDVERAYTADNSNRSVVGGSLFAGVRQSVAENLELQIGPSFTRSASTTLSGAIWEDADPQFDNHSYQYDVRHTQLALKAKLALDAGIVVRPWVSAGLGIAFNESQGYTSTPKIAEAVEGARFADNTTTAFSYSLGLGVETTLTAGWHAGLGYEFSDWGKSALGSTGGQAPSLSIPHLYTSGITLTVTYLL